jgi:hypothetical protein
MFTAYMGLNAVFQADSGKLAGVISRYLYLLIIF